MGIINDQTIEAANRRGWEKPQVAATRRIAACKQAGNPSAWRLKKAMSGIEAIYRSAREQKRIALKP